MDEVRIYDTALNATDNATEIASSFTTGPEVPNPINLETVYFEDFETGYSNGDPVTNKAEWTVGNATVVDSPGVLGGGTAAGLPDGHGLVLGGFADTTENKVSFGDVTADKVYMSFDLYQTVDHQRGLTFDVVDGSQDTVYAIWNLSSTDVINHSTAGGRLCPVGGQLWPVGSKYLAGSPCPRTDHTAVGPIFPGCRGTSSAAPVRWWLGLSVHGFAGSRERGE